MSQDETAVNDQVVADTTATESAPVENTSEVADEFDGLGDVSLTDIPAETETEGKSEDTASEQEQSDAAGETETETQPQEGEKPLSPKAEKRFHQLANERNQLKAELEALRAREAQFAQEQNLVNEINPETGEYYTPQEIERIAWQQSRETQAQQVAEQRYALEVQQNQQTIASETQKAIQEFPMFDEKSPEYSPELAQLADQRLGRALITDENGQILGAHDSPYEILKTIADATKANAAKYEATAQKATEKMLANADNPGGSPQKASKGDELDDLFEKIKDVKFV